VSFLEDHAAALKHAEAMADSLGFSFWRAEVGRKGRPTIVHRACPEIQIVFWAGIGYEAVCFASATIRAVGSTCGEARERLAIKIREERKRLDDALAVLPKEPRKGG
jgi:hypothetical protein